MFSQFNVHDHHVMLAVAGRRGLLGPLGSRRSGASDCLLSSQSQTQFCLQTLLTRSECSRSLLTTVVTMIVLVLLCNYVYLRSETPDQEAENEIL